MKAGNKLTTLLTAITTIATMAAKAEEKRALAAKTTMRKFPLQIRSTPILCLWALRFRRQLTLFATQSKAFYPINRASSRRCIQSVLSRQFGMRLQKWQKQTSFPTRTQEMSCTPAHFLRDLR